MGSAVVQVPFPGQPPLVRDGDQCWARDAGGRWRRKMARSAPRYDLPNALGGRCHLTVAVSEPGDHRWVNWPAEAVRADPPEEVEDDR